MARVSLRTIAEKVGCSRSTVSYALKNHPSISPAMRKKIRAVAEELGWTRNRELAEHMSLVRKTLSEQDLPSLALVINKSEAELEREYAPRLQLQGAYEYAVKRGYSVHTFNLAEAPMPADKLAETLAVRGIQGIIFIATVAPAIPVDYLKVGKAFSCAVVGVRYLDVPFHVAIPDQKSAARNSIKKLLDMGYRRPGVVLPRELDRTLDWGFGGGAFAGLNAVAEAERVPLLHVGKAESGIPDYAKAEILEWIRQHQPDALLTTDGRKLPEILRQARAKRIRGIPVFALDLSDHKGVAGGIDEQHLEVGKAGVELVVAQMHRRDKGVPAVQQAVLIEGKWKVF